MADQSQIDIHPTCIVCVEASLTGEVTIGAGTVIQPNATLRATNGPIRIGERCLVEENVLIENMNEDGSPLIIGDDNVFEVGAVVHARSVGNNNVFSVLSIVGTNVDVTNGCCIGVRCSVMRHGELPCRTCVYGERNERRISAEDPKPQTTILEVIRKMMPSYHKLVVKRKVATSPDTSSA